MSLHALTGLIVLVGFGFFPALLCSLPAQVVEGARDAWCIIIRAWWSPR